MEKQNIKKFVQDAYGKIASSKKGCGCGGTAEKTDFAKSIGYSEKELQSIPADANLGLSCGNPTAIAGLKAGEVVLDLGSGAGFDCFLAASQVGPKGRVIGVDMTPEMLAKARDNAKKNNIGNVEFRKGIIEALPVSDASIDVAISNCVINLSTDKPKVFREIFRVLKPGGRMIVSDIALTQELPTKLKENMSAYAACVSGALTIDEYTKAVHSSGLKNIQIEIKNSSSCIMPDTNDPLGKALIDSFDEGQSLDGIVVSVNVEGYK